MNKIVLITFAGLLIMSTGCGKKEQTGIESPAFMFWCYRQEVVSSDFHIPEMTTPGRTVYIQNRLKSIPGFAGSKCDLQNRILTISYASSTVRKMNFEEGIALLGFSVNGRPADPRATLPNGMK